MKVWGEEPVFGCKLSVCFLTGMKPLILIGHDCDDFINEESMLQYYGRLMGVAVNRTPKCHCELAGEGIEYSWAASKNTYQRFPVGAKKRKEQFRNSVSECLSRQVITTTLVRAFSRRARQYICAYHALHDQQQTGTELATDSKITAPLIEKLVKKFKTHRAVIDFDNRFVATMVKMEEGEDAN
jgi:ribosomal protein L17